MSLTRPFTCFAIAFGIVGLCSAQSILGKAVGGANWIDVSKHRGLSFLAVMAHKPGDHKVRLTPDSLTIGDIVVPSFDSQQSERATRMRFTRSDQWMHVGEFLATLPLDQSIDKASLTTRLSKVLDASYASANNQNIGFACSLMLLSCYKAKFGKKMENNESGRLSFLIEHFIYDDYDFSKMTNDQKQAVFEDVLLTAIVIKLLEQTAIDSKSKEDIDAAHNAAQGILEAILG